MKKLLSNKINVQIISFMSFIVLKLSIDILMASLIIKIIKEWA